MSDPTSIFNSSNPPVTPENQGGSNPPNVQIDPAIATLLSEIKNERGEPKYKSLQDAVVALKHSQEYIPTLAQKIIEKDNEIATLKGSVDKVTELERAVLALTQKSETPPTSGAPVTEEQIASLVTKSLTRAQEEAKAATNLSEVVNTMKQKFGDNAEASYNAKAQELGMTVAEFNALAARNPKAVLKLIGVDAITQNNGTGAPTTPSLNTSGFVPKLNSFVGRNDKSTLIGATTQDMKDESSKAKAMVDELHAQGLTVHDLTDPKIYFKQFAKG